MMKKSIVTGMIMMLISSGSMAALNWSGPQYLDVQYKTAGGQTLLLDIYLPNTAAPSPVVVYTHGGGWASGDKNSIEYGYKSQVATQLLEAGVAVVTVGYRLAVDGTIIQDCIIDSKDACRFMSKYASEYNIDKTKMAMFGDSAGAHIAMMCTVSANAHAGFAGVDELADYNDYKINGCVAWYGPVSFREEEESFWTDGGRALSNFDERLFADETNVSTQTYLRNICSPYCFMKSITPPLFLIQGKDDTTIPVHHAYGMRDKAEAVGNTSFEFQEVANSGHNFVQSGTEAIDPSGATIVTLSVNMFLNYLGVDGSGSTAPIGKDIWLKANANWKYVCADKLLGTYAPLHANRTALGAWEKFTVVDADDGYIALKANSIGKYVAADQLTINVPLQPRYQTTTIGSWEKFTWVENSDGTISLKANANGKYVSADKLVNSTTVPLCANRTAIGSWEKFTWGEY